MRRVIVQGRYVDEITSDPTKAAALDEASASFAGFVKYWRFLDQQTGELRCLGDELWESQHMFIQATDEDDRIFFLKARKLGETTIECAWDGWVMRFRDHNARVHLFSRRDAAAQELLAMVKFGLERLPEYMRLDIGKDTTHELELIAGADDRRLAVAYPANEETAVESTCTHGHVDEWARMKNPRKVWQAIEATMAGSCHIVTTGLGPGNYSAEFWRLSETGATGFKPFFVDSLRRPDRNSEWLEAKLRSFPRRVDGLREYPMTAEHALAGDSSYFFEDHELTRAAEEALGPTRPIVGRTYVKGWDVGRHGDAAVGVVLDVTDTLVDVVWYERLVNHPYPTLQAVIDQLHLAYPGPTAIESNAAGEAVAENLELPADELVLFSTTGKSKPRILGLLKARLQKELLKYDAMSWPQIDGELRAYQLQDAGLVQDTVMALAIANAHVTYARTGRWHKQRRGRSHGVIQI